MSAAQTRVLVVGLGNPDRGDDGAGALVARRLGSRAPAGMTVTTRAGDMLALIEDWTGFETVVLVDAAAAAGTPGRICRIDPSTDDLAAQLLPLSSHGLGLAETIALARALGALPAHVVVYAIEGAEFAAGAPLTPAVAAAAEEVAACLAAEFGAAPAC